MTFQPVESYTRVRLSDVVSDQIKSLISAGKLLPGQKLPTERELAAQLNVSRPSLREALVRLEADGFIGSVGRGGFVVSDITAPVVSSPLADLLLQNPEASHDVLELRHGLETISTAYAAERATPGDLAKIKEAFDTLAGHSLKHEPGRLAEVDANFHLAIADATHNVALIHVMHGIHGLLQESMHKSHRLVNHADAMERALLEQHTEIYEAIAAKDPNARARRRSGTCATCARCTSRRPDTPRRARLAAPGQCYIGAFDEEPACRRTIRGIRWRSSSSPPKCSRRFPSPRSAGSSAIGSSSSSSSSGRTRS